MRVCLTKLVLTIGILWMLPASLAVAQQDKGDKEFGIDGAATISTTTPINGQAFAEISFGKYLSTNNYIGLIAAPQFSFAKGSYSGGALLGGEYRFLFGTKKTNRLWPFIGAQADYDYMRSGGSNQNLEAIAPEAGIKLYVSQKTAFEISYLLEIQFGGQYSSFGDRSINLILFGFKHIF